MCTSAAIGLNSTLHSNQGGNFAFNIPTLTTQRPIDLIIEVIPPVNDLVKLSIAKTTVRVGGVLKYSKDFTYSQTIDSTLLVWDQMMNYNPAQILVRAKTRTPTPT